MAEQASQIAREAKGIQQGLKEALKTRDPWDKEVEFQRRNLRRQHLRLLLTHPYAKESKDVENLLWMQTSYAFISTYKQRIATLDRALQSTPRNQPRQGGHGPVEYRKLMQRFRQFLAEEERFWAKLIDRLHRSFSLDEAHSAIALLGIVADDAGLDTGEQPLQRDANGRNHFQFPLEESSPPESLTDRAGRMAILSKAMVCLGDIARYRELYNESGGRPKAGHEENSPARKNGRNKRGGAAGMDPIPRARNYDKAQQCYEQARLLVPHEGNPSHQLAILASYQRDLFGSLVHYYRALCVLQPYDTASENLGVVLNKALDQWRNRMKQEKEKPVDKNTQSLAPRLRVEMFKEKVVVLHALWRLGVDRMESTSPKHAEGVLEDFASLVADRVLPIDTISKVIVLAQGALWKHRTIRDSASSGTVSPPILIESHIATHILGLHRILLEVGLVQLAESPPHDAAENDLAQWITATFRRMLPALRIAGKWLRANFKYVQSGAIEEVALEKKKGKSLVISDVPLFWDTYAQFTSALYRSFPAERLPVLASSLEEDVDMRGFLPLKKLMAEDDSGGDGKSRATAQVHPNEEQLMRIADLLNDAKVLIELENSPLILSKTQIVAHAGGSLVQSPSVIYNGARGETASPRHPVPPSTIVQHAMYPHPMEREDDVMTEASRDDPVGDAFRQVLDGSDRMDSDEDEIVWNPRAPASPVRPVIPLALASPPHTISMSPVAPSFVPRSPAIQSPIRPPAKSPIAKPAVTIIPTHTTAQDLVDSIMGFPRDSPADVFQRADQSTAPQPQLLFGSGPPNLPGHSIWSMSLDNSSTNFPPTTSGLQLSRPFDSPLQQFARSPQNLSQPLWPTSYEPDMGSQNRLGVGAIPSSHSPHLQHINTGFSHRRVPSGYVFSNQSPRNDAYGYAPGSPQQSYNQHVHPALARIPFVDPAIMSDYRNNPSHHYDPRLGQIAPAAIPQLWGNNG